MADNTIKFPTRFRRPRKVKPREIWDQDKPPSEMVWEVCPYLRMHLDTTEWPCMECPEWEDHPRHGKVQKSCYGLAEEVCRIVFAMQKQPKEEK